MRRFTVIALISVMLVAPAVYAESGARADPPRPSIRGSVAHVRFDAKQHTTFQVSSPAHTVSAADKVNAAMAFGLLGIFAGGYLGEQLDKHCYCENKHAWIGMQIGGVAGAIIGWHLAR